MQTEFERIRDAYLSMARSARYRPAAPGDGLGNVTLSAAELGDTATLAAEATDYAARFTAEQESLSFSIGCANYTTNRALVFVIEAARLLCSGIADHVAAKLLRMALSEVRASRAAQVLERRT